MQFLRDGRGVGTGVPLPFSVFSLLLLAGGEFRSGSLHCTERHRSPNKMMMYSSALVRSLSILLLLASSPTGTALRPRLGTGGEAEGAGGQRRDGFRRSDQQAMAAAASSSRSLFLEGSASSNRGLEMMSMMKKRGASCKGVKGKGRKGVRMNPKMDCSNKPTGRSATPGPSLFPSIGPSDRPSVEPSDRPSRKPSASPSVPPSLAPSAVPSSAPSLGPSSRPSLEPSDSPTGKPSGSPSQAPSRSFCLELEHWLGNGHRYLVAKSTFSSQVISQYILGLPPCCGGTLAHLATVTDEAEDAFLNRLMLDAGASVGAFGLVRVESGWVWVTGEKVTEYATNRTSTLPVNDARNSAFEVQNNGVGPGAWYTWRGSQTTPIGAALVEYDCTN